MEHNSTLMSLERVATWITIIVGPTTLILGILPFFVQLPGFQTPSQLSEVVAICVTLLIGSFFFSAQLLLSLPLIDKHLHRDAGDTAFLLFIAALFLGLIFSLPFAILVISVIPVEFPLVWLAGYVGLWGTAGFASYATLAER